MKVAGVVTLYNPDNSINQNIKSYINDIDFLFVVDNSSSNKIDENVIAEIEYLSRELHRAPTI